MNFETLNLEKITEFVALYGLRVLAAVAIFFVGRYAAKFITRLCEKLMTRAKVDPILVGFLGNIFYALILAFVIIAAISKLGVQTTSLVAVIGAAGLAIGLALQNSLGNFASGVMMIIFRPFKVGDYVEAGGTAGRVKEINIFTTTFTSLDNKLIIVPNGQITDGNIVNYSAMKTRRLDMVFGIGYDDDIKKAKEVLTKILTDSQYVLKSPEPVVAVLELADSSVNFAVRPWVNNSDFLDARFSITEEVKLRFDKEGISIPFPQRDVHVQTVPKALAANDVAPKKAPAKPKKPAAKKKAS